MNAPAHGEGVTGAAIQVVFTKYDGSLHWHHGARLLGEDEHGVWAGCPAGTSGRRGFEPPVVWRQPFVMLFPRDAWWTACFNGEPEETAIYCDVATVPRWRDGQVTMVDLDLDVLLLRSGRLFVDDEDEFAEHRVRYCYPGDVVARAERSAAWLMSAVGRGAAPFGGGHQPWLSQVC
ncbi:DUF402 domain-containing protein [Sphaerisporangium sp. TRM90804]|uniref:DUF402 domain-containing protein n=1 Tax=Sphaerisporangium sp. TRM90804 TaxID=3031113 RepID=UPI00244ACC51|nr:DUF402 domain-containing protein [Sphaerisporangium sp. TRM90804]MDH2425186.1 DUF402 domain-containing protein [Sphaerisporangium sp. TRM90804]